MRKVREVLRLRWGERLSGRDVARSCSISRSTVQDTLRRAEAAGLSWPLPETLDDATLEQMLYPKAPPSNRARPEPDPAWIHQELRKAKNVTLQLLWEEYKAAHPDGLQYTQFCQRYRRWVKGLDVTMHQVHRAGEKMFVDFAGETVAVIDLLTGEVRQAQIFVAVLGASSYTYAEACWSQDLASWIGAHCRAYVFFGGVARITVPDNVKAGVTHPSYYEPDINPTYQEMADHYGTIVIPTRPRKPKDKPKAESGVLQVERRILAALRNRSFFSLEELNRAIAEELDKLNDRPFQKLEGSRRSLYEELDRPALQPLPATTYVFAAWKKARVNIDYHVEVEKAFYSVPHPMVRTSQQVDVRLTAGTVEVFHKGQRLASHPRQYRKGAYSTDKHHLPAAHRAHAEWSPSRLIHWGEKIGPNTGELVRGILESKPHPEMGYRSCLGLMRLGRQYSPERLEAACKRAIGSRALSYQSVKSILESGLDRVPLETPQSLPAIRHANLRGAGYYQEGGEGSC